jgi:hypothetical protein
MRLDPGFQYKTLLKDSLLLTRVVIDPGASGRDFSLLVLGLEKSRAPVCQVDGSEVLSVAVNIQVLAGVEIFFSVQGSAAVHVSGFYEPCFEDEDRELFVSSGLLEV